MIRERSHERVRDRVDHKRNHDRSRREGRRQSQHLVVVEEQKRVEREVLPGIRQRADALKQPG
jgi:hypothetical protein